MRNPRLTDERGMALAAAIFALVVIGALVAGAFYASTLEQRTGRNSMYAAEAAQAAETGPMAVMANWDQYALNNMGNGSTTSLGTTYMTGRTDMKYTVSATRLNDQLYLLTSLGSRVDPSGAELARSTRGHAGALELRVGHGQGRGHRHQAGQVQRQRVQRDRERLASEGLGQGQPGQRRPELHQGRRPGGHPERHHDRRGQRRTRTTSSARRRRWPTIRPSPATSSTSSATSRSTSSRRTRTSSFPETTPIMPPRTCSRRRRSAATSRPVQLGRARAHRRLHQGVLHLLPDHLRQRVAGEDGGRRTRGRGCSWSRATWRSSAGSSSTA